MTTKQIADGLVNVVSGLGTQATKRAHNQFQYANLTSFQQLDCAYMSNWLARQIVDVPAEDMTREWRSHKCEDADIIRAEEDRLQIPIAANTALAWARLYGGGAILMLTGQDLSKPLNLNRIKKGGLQRVIVFDRWDLSAMTINTWNVLAANYLQPEFYTVRGGAQQIHWSHFARFNGARLPLRQMAITQGWGDSELRKCMDDIMDMVASKDGIAELMQEANVDVVKREGLTDELASDQDDAIISRYALFSQMKSIVHMALLDGDETYERKTLDLGGVAPVIEMFMTWISGAADIPLTRLFGTSAKGLNATGEGDLTNYYNSIRAKQLTQLDPGMRQLDEVLVRSALGHWPDDYNYIWNPLAQLNEKEIAEARRITAEMDQTYLDLNVIQLSQVQRNLQSAETYQFADEDIEQLEADEDAGMLYEPPGSEPEPVATGDYLAAFQQMVRDGVDPHAAVAAL